MARKDVLSGIITPSPERNKDSGSSNYAMRGASRSMLSSIGELSAQAARAEKLLDGAAVIDLNTDLIDASFVSDRMADIDEAYIELREAIREHGQDTPILVRPHPEDNNRYMVVFGHRRLRVAKELDRTVKAVIKTLDDSSHVIAQGQENSARDNLSFIERAVFAQKLIDLQYDRQIIQTALSTDNPMLTRMLSVTKRIPSHLIETIGPAKSVGRDRWIDFASQFEKVGARVLDGLFSSSEFSKIENSNDRFANAYIYLKSTTRTQPKKKAAQIVREWATADKAVNFSMKRTLKKVDLSLKSSDAGEFGDWLSERLEQFYQQFKTKSGD